MAGKHSLWMVPSGEAHERLQDLISGLAAAHGTPVFRPHVTLLGGLTAPLRQIEAKATRLASSLRPFMVRFSGIGHADEYYRCLFLRVRKTRDVMAANAMAREAFDRVGDRPFMPHLSLMYCDFDASRKEETASAVGADVLGIAFEVDAICVFSTDGEPGQWKGVLSLPLMGC